MHQMTTTTTSLQRTASPDRTQVLAEAQVAFLAIVLFLATAVTFGALPAAGMGAGTLAAAWVSTRVRARRDIVVIGDAEFCSRVGVAAMGRRRVAARYVIEDDDQLIRAVVPAYIPSCDEVVVDGRYFTAVRRAAPHLLHPEKAVLVAPGGQVDETIFDEPLGLGNRWVKRALDLVVASVGLLLVGPVLLIAMVAIKLDSKGPAIFQQDRLGASGRRFRLYKLRTMKTDNDDSAHQAYVAAMIRGEAEQKEGMFKLVDDPRITRVGKFLRKTSIDELPQLWNVLRGEMSLVGPRPPMMSEAELYEDWAWQRLRAKPGLTGLWQVSGRCELTFDEMVALDVEYARRWSPLLELQILAKTPKVVLTARGAA
jgi:lipopolysaccharide/colanic/teichoic acid biosynthesis glycosyltransferase